MQSSMMRTARHLPYLSPDAEPPPPPRRQTSHPRRQTRPQELLSRSLQSNVNGPCKPHHDLSVKSETEKKDGTCREQFIRNRPYVIDE